MHAPFATALQSANGLAPDWIHLLPPGEFSGRDGRSYTMRDATSLMDALTKRGIDLPIDYHHQHDRPPKGHVGPVPAAGWIKELRSDETGIWGRAEWTAEAAKLISARSYRYVSPVFQHTVGGDVKMMMGAALVHLPNLTLTALNDQEPEMDKTAFRTTLIEALGLPEDSTSDEVLDALGQRLTKQDSAAAPDPAKYVPIEALQDAMRDRNANTATMSEERRQAKIDEALRQGHITPGMRPWAMALCASDPDSFDSFITSTGAVFGHLTKKSHTGEIHPSRTALMSEQDGTDRDTLNIATQLGISPDKLRE